MERTAHRWPEAREYTALGKHPSAGMGIVEMPRSLLAPGVYSVSLSADDIQLVTVKFIALR